MTRLCWCDVLLLLFLFQALSHTQALQAPPTWAKYRGSLNFPNFFRIGNQTQQAQSENVDFDVDVVGEISALAFDQHGALLGISDNRVLYTMRVNISEQGQLRDIVFESSLFLSGLPDALLTSLDTEGLIVLPSQSSRALGGSIIVSSEQEPDSVLDIGLFSTNGSFMSFPFSIPSIVASNSRLNAGFEALCLSGDAIVTATEYSLAVDPEQLRLLHIPLNGSQTSRQLRYTTDSVGLGLVELLAFDDLGLFGGKFLAMERSFTVGIGNTIRLFVVDTEGAEDVSMCDNLGSTECANKRGVTKTLLCDLATIPEAALGNYEAMTFIPNHACSQSTNDQSNCDTWLVLLAVDNNNNPKQDGTWFTLLEIGSTQTEDSNSVWVQREGVWGWGDVNAVIVTDVHSWLSGHKHADHTPTLTSNYAHFVGFLSKMRQAAQTLQKDLFVFDNGDVVHGTGLSDVISVTDENGLVENLVHGQVLSDLLVLVPLDAVNLGNHELYDWGTVEMFRKPNGYFEHFANQMVTSNVRLRATGEPLAGRRYFRLIGSASARNYVVFGFLYNMKDSCAEVEVVDVEDVVEEEWFATALTDGAPQVVFVLAHMHLTNALLSVILQKIRQVRGLTVPVVFITGHTHIRGSAFLDANAFSFEAGHFGDTIGILSVDLAPTTATQGQPRQSATFRHRFLNTNLEGLKHFVGQFSTSTVFSSVPEAVVMHNQISQARKRLQLDTVVGCAAQDYSIPEIGQIFGNEIVPFVLQLEQDSTVFVWNIHSMRYKLFQGEVTIDDLYTVSPFSNYFVQSVQTVDTTALQTAINNLPSGFLFWPPNFAATQATSFRIVTEIFQVTTIRAAFTNTTQPSFSRLDTAHNSSSVLVEFVRQKWACAPAEDKSGHTSELTTAALVVAIFLLVLSTMAVVIEVIRDRLQGQSQRRSAVHTELV